jgi:hypothetical protein
MNKDIRRDITIKVLVNKKELAVLKRRVKLRTDMGLPFSLSGFVRFMALCADIAAAPTGKEQA